MLGRSAMLAMVAVVAAGVLVMAPLARAHSVTEGDVPGLIAVHGGEENYNGTLLSRHARKGMGMSAANDGGDGELRVEEDPYGRTMGKGGSSMGGSSDGGTQDRVVVTEVSALKLRFTGELSSPVVAKKGKKESSIVGTTSGGVTWRCVHIIAGVHSSLALHVVVYITPLSTRLAHFLFQPHAKPWCRAPSLVRLNTRQLCCDMHHYGLSPCTRVAHNVLFTSHISF